MKKLFALATFLLLSNLGNAQTCLTTFEVTTTADSMDGDCSLTDCSLREAVEAANLCPGLNNIHLKSGTYILQRSGTEDPGKPPLANSVGDLDVLEDVRIYGDAKPRVPGPAIIDANRIDRIFEIHKGTLRIDRVSLTNGLQIDSSNYGSTVHIRKTASFVGQNLAIYNNGSLTDPVNKSAAIMNESILRLTDVVLDNNSIASSNGGSVYNSTDSSSRLTRVVAKNHLNGVITSTGTMTIEDSQFHDNNVDVSTPDKLGGALVIYKGLTTINRTIFRNNRAYLNGAAIHYESYNDLNRGSLTIDQVTFRSNLAETPTSTNEGGGGAMAVYGNTADVTVRNSVFVDNRTGGLSKTYGGAVFNWGSDLKSNGSVFMNNSSVIGGAIANMGSALLKENSYVSNAAAYGGGVFVQGHADIRNSTFSSNLAAGGPEGPGGIVEKTGAAVEFGIGSGSLKNVTMVNNGGNYSIAFLASPFSDVAVSYTAITNNLGIEDCLAGVARSKGYNASSTSGCPFNEPSDFMGGPLDIGTLTDMGSLAGAPGDQMYPKHHRLLSTSRLLNGGESFHNNFDGIYQAGCLINDAVGTPRPQGGFCDIGAIEGSK